MKKALLSLSVLAVMLTFAACKKDNPAPPTTASVMFVNGCAGAGNVDVSVNGTKLGAASSLSFLKNSGYQPITSGSGIAMAFALTSTGTPLDNGTEPLITSAHYTAFASGLVTGTSFVFVTDDLTAPAAGMAKVRFVNLSSDGLNLDCYIGTGTPKIDSNVTYGTVTPFSSVSPVTNSNVLLIDPSSPTKLAQLPAQTFSAGKIYTIMLTGTSSGTLTSVLTVTIINNN